MADANVSEFMAVTNSDAETAKFYLESCGGDVSRAVESFFTNSEPREIPVDAAPPVEPAATQPAQQRPRIAGFGDVDDESSEDDEGPEDNEYYAGGEKSGVAVKGGKKTDHVENLFESARQHGAEQGTEADLRAPSGSQAFTGRARTLTGDVTSHAPEPSEPQPVTITFYTNGVFTIDDGEARNVDDPRNAQFLDSIRRGMCPPELTMRNGGRPVKVNLIRSGTEYQPPAKPKYVAFGGMGQMLSDGGSSSAPVYTEPLGGAWEGTDESQPATSIQLVSPAGDRVVTRFNLSHTVRDIRRYVAAVHPDWSFKGEMRAGHPAQPLDDDSITIGQAQLGNSVIVLR